MQNKQDGFGIPVGSGPTSEVWVDTNNGLGGSSSGDGNCLNYKNIRVNNGKDITYFPQSTLTGDRFVINAFGYYHVTCLMASSSATYTLGATINSTATSTSVAGLTYAQGYRGMSWGNSALGYSAMYSAVFQLKPGDIIRIQTSTGTRSSSDSNDFCRVMKIG